MRHQQRDSTNVLRRSIELTSKTGRSQLLRTVKYQCSQIFLMRRQPQCPDIELYFLISSDREAIDRPLCF